MKVVMVMQHINFFRNLDTVVRELDARGHETVMLHGTRLDTAKSRAKFDRKKQTMVFMGRGLEHAETAIPSVSTGYRPEPDEPWHKRLRAGREVMNYSIYLRKDHPGPERIIEGLEARLPQGVARWLKRFPVKGVLRSRLALRTWRTMERLGPKSPTVTALLEELQPDVLLVSPTVWPKGPIEADYTHAAQRLGIPTVGYVNSWDNLTSKGTPHVLPDAFIVWNEPMATEATDVHAIPRKIIRVTGAPHLDHFFELQPSQSRAEICDQLGCPDDGPYVLYLCSSRTLITDETHIVTALAEALERRFPDGAPTIVVRPHPVNPDPWESYARPGVTVFPKLGDQADTPEAWQEYYNQLSSASCFFGLNTTAFLEAAVADHPCLTVVSDEFHAVQGRTGHFRHLRDADFLEVSNDMDETAGRVARILDGADERSEERRRFAEAFLRPRGLETRASTIVADTLEEIAGYQGSPTERPRADLQRRAEPALAAKEDTR
jgi:hypothetical protein